MRTRLALRLPLCVLSMAVSMEATACSSAPEEEEPVGTSSAPLTAVCETNVKGIGLVPTEEDYLPHVVHCENGGAPYEALKAQAIAARTYMYYKMETAGAVADGTGDQVYSCGSGPTAEQIKAVKETAGRVLRYKGVTICAFFVAGGAASPPDCHGGAASTEKYVTYNEGKSGSGIDQTSLGFVSPTNYRNRGCLSQLGSRCLDNAGKTVDEILQFYYGADIVFETATGPCVPTEPADTGVTDTGTAATDSSTPVEDSSATDAAVEDAAGDTASDTG
ncbi:MAG: SpoIID/LytB domain-containing protein, partial [Polyangiales bacterium]